MSAKQHLKELQIRFTFVAVVFVIGASLAYAFQEQVIPFLLAPIGEEKLIYLNPAGGFNFIFLVSIYAGLALATPIIIQQLYAFLRPALPVKARKKSTAIIIGSFFLLLAGVAFGYFIAVPSALQFLYGFADKYVEASLTADSYLNFVIAYTIGIGLVFQIPLLLLLVHAVKPLTPGGLMRSERWVILISFIIAAIITPTPDPINQAIIAGPVIIVYQLGVVIILWNIAKNRRHVKKRIRHVTAEAHKRKQENAHLLVPVHLQESVVAVQETPKPAGKPVAASEPAKKKPVAAATAVKKSAAKTTKKAPVASQKTLQKEIRIRQAITVVDEFTHASEPKTAKLTQTVQAVRHPEHPHTIRRHPGSIDGIRHPARGKIQPPMRPATQK